MRISDLSSDVCSSDLKFLDFNMVFGNCAIEETIRDLVDIRASQLNGCAFCLDMHVKSATIHGERPLRLHHVAIWRESTLFSQRDRNSGESGTRVSVRVDRGGRRRTKKQKTSR